MNQLSPAKRVQIVSALVAGCSLRSTTRMADVSLNTVTKLMVELGTACRAYHDAHVRGLFCQKIQCHAIWSFCYAKARNIPADRRASGETGSVWTWTGMDSQSKLMVSWCVDTRDADGAYEFMSDLAARLAWRVQLSTDGHKPYLEAVEGELDHQIDYALLVKLYGASPKGPQTRHSRAAGVGARVDIVTGAPDPAAISTSDVEQQNLTTPTGRRRFTRLTNAFSKKAENLAHAVALHFMHYNFCRVHQTRRVTPAMEAGLTDRVWGPGDLVALLSPPVRAGWGSKSGRRAHGDPPKYSD